MIMDSVCPIHLAYSIFIEIQKSILQIIQIQAGDGVCASIQNNNIKYTRVSASVSKID
jgi:hypothetical protein